MPWFVLSERQRSACRISSHTTEVIKNCVSLVELFTYLKWCCGQYLDIRVYKIKLHYEGHGVVAEYCWAGQIKED